MSSVLAATLLVLALALPFFGALALRVLAPRLSAGQFYGAAAAIFALVIALVFVLARSNTERLQIGNLSLLLPVSAPIDTISNDLPVVVPTVAPPSNTGEPTATVATTAAPTLLATTASVSPTVEITPTATPEPPTTTPEPPTATPEPPTTTPEPPTATPEPAAPAPQQRTYTVQAGDTLRGIAEQFNVSVSAILQANNLTPEQADSLRPGQELIIP